MPSIISIAMKEQIRLASPFIQKMSVEQTRTAQDKLGEMGIKALGSKIKTEPVAMDNFEAELITPVTPYENSSGKAILYLHGGGYVAGRLPYARGFAGILAANVGYPVFCAAYRLAPEFPYPAALEDAFAAYQKMLEMGYEAKNISLCGESAGGGLIFALLHYLRDNHHPLPCAAVALSPWTDLTFSGESYRLNQKKDPSISEQVLRSYADMYAPEQAALPYVSPVFGDHTGFPPSFIIAGGDEVLLSDSTMLHLSLKASGCESTLLISEGMWHVFPLYGLPESKDALEKLTDFIHSKGN